MRTRRTEKAKLKKRVTLGGWRGAVILTAGVLCIAAMLAGALLTNFPLRQASTKEAVLICGHTEHTHTENCYDADGQLTCGLDEHVHTADCYAQVEKAVETPPPAPTTAPTPEPTRVVAQFVAMLEQPSAQPEESAAAKEQETQAPVTEAPVTEVPVTEAPATEVPVTETPATEVPVTQVPAVTPAPATPEPIVETPTPAPTPVPLVLNGLSPDRAAVAAGETIVWHFNISGATSAAYGISNQKGESFAGGSLTDERSISFTAPSGGVYTFTLAAQGEDGQQQAITSSVTVAAADELIASVTSSMRYAFAYDNTLVFDTAVQGGTAPYTVTYQVEVGGKAVYTVDGIQPSFGYMPTQYGVHTLYMNVTDALGATASARYSVPVAEHTDERRADWEKRFEKIELTGSFAQDILTIAYTQLGYKESITDFIIDANGDMQGYTRFGRWYGYGYAEYSEWCAMFVSFAASYAQIPAQYIPREANTGKFIRESGDLYVDAATGYVPAPGDLIFFNYEGGPNSQHMGIVSELKNDVIKVISGNSEKMVRESDYPLFDESIIGYVDMGKAMARYAAANPTGQPPEEPTAEPTAEATEEPTAEPTAEVTEEPTAEPTAEVTEEPTAEPTVEPTIEPTLEPTAEPTAEPTEQPAEELPGLIAICGLEEHTHDENCYDAEGHLTCDLIEHVHTEACYEEGAAPTAEPEQSPDPRTAICGLEEHTHNEDCYDAQGNLICELVEHVHTEVCYEEAAAEPTPEPSEGPLADTSADLEGPADWQNAVAGVSLTNDWAQDLLNIARTQLGYRQSELNFIADEAGNLNHYSRYGAWYGNPYAADWSTQFIAFVMNYAGITDVPTAANAADWMESLRAYGMFRWANDYTAQPGDWLLLDLDGNGIADHAAIVEAADGNITVIEGGLNGEVARNVYAANDTRILGYGHPETTLVDEATGVYVTGILPTGAVLTVQPIEEEVIAQAEAVLEENAELELDTQAPLAEDENVSTRVTRITYDITLGAKQPGKNVRVSIPVPQDFGSDALNVYNLDDENFARVQEMPGEPSDDGQWYTFTTSHFSVFQLAAIEITPLAVTRPTRLNTVSNKDDGIRLDLFDYGPVELDYGTNSYESPKNVGINRRPTGFSSNKTKTTELMFFTWGSTASTTTLNHYSGSNAVVQGIVRALLGSDGYPVLSTGAVGSTNPYTSLDYLFNGTNYGTNSTTKKVYPNVDKLFTKDSDGYYKYDSRVNYAYLYDQTNMVFDVYNTTYNKSGGGSVGFFPFDAYDTTKTSVSQGGSASDLPQHNHHFGMSMSAKFMMPEGRKINGNDMVFEFSGDDDVWVFIDGVLVLDMGGIHGTASGSINFQTGMVSVTTGVMTVANRVSGAGTVIGASKSIATIFTQAGKTWNSADYSEHELKFFYMERGGQESNCSIKFNLPTIPKEQITIAKKVDVPADYASEYAEKTFNYRLYVETGVNTNNYTLYSGSGYLNGGTTATTITSGAFSLKHGQTMVIRNLESPRRYYVQELNVNGSEYESVLITQGSILQNGSVQGSVVTNTVPLINGQTTTVSSTSNPQKIIGDHPVILFTNKVRLEKGLEVVKVWDEADGSDSDHAEMTVPFQLFVDGGSIPISYDGATTFSLTGTAWTKSFPNLITRVGTRNIAYTVVETVPGGYEQQSVVSTTNSGDGRIIRLTITNKRIVGSLKVDKVWTDGNSNHPAGSISFNLYKKVGVSGTPMLVSSYTLTGPNWTMTINNLPVKSGADDIYYSVVETSVPGGYSVSYDPADTKLTSGGTATLAIKNTPNTTSVSVKKLWQNLDGSPYTGTLSSNVHIKLHRRSEEGAPSASPEMHTVKFYVRNTGSIIESGRSGYYPSEDGVQVEHNGSVSFIAYRGYAPAPVVTATTGGILGLDGTRQKDIYWEFSVPYQLLSNVTDDVTVTITFPEDFWTSQLQPFEYETRPGTSGGGSTSMSVVTEENVKEINLPYNGGWEYTWDDLDALNGEGNPYYYFIEENPVPSGFTLVGYGNNGGITSGEITVTNKRTSIPVEKVWNDSGTRTISSVSVSLIKTIASTSETVQTIELLASKGWKGEFTNISYDASATYSVVEDPPISGYSYTVTGDALTGFTVKNTKVVNVTVNKIWEDGLDHTAGPAITITLKKQVGTVTSDAGTITLPDAVTGWTHTFADLPQYDETGNEILYSVSETPVSGYVSVVSESSRDAQGNYSFTITNTPSYTIVVEKRDTSGSGTKLKDVEFEFYREAKDGDTGTTTIQGVTESVVKVNGTYTTSNDGRITLEGLYPGKYWLVETKTLDGYMQPLGPFGFTLNGNGSITILDENTMMALPGTGESGIALILKNQKGAELPATGGPGNSLDTWLGMAFVMLAGLMYIAGRSAKRRKGAGSF